ncbi:MAG: ribosome silencing factor [Bacteriovoracaceae bacterium]
MSTDFKTKEINNIMSSETFTYPLNVAMSAAWILGNYKGLNLKVIDVGDYTSIAQYFVIGSTTNNIQSLAIADEIAKTAMEYNQPIVSQEGKDGSDWVLLDLGNVIVHIFNETARDKYALDDLWNKAPQIEIPNTYYHSAPETVTNNGPQGNYF